MILKEDVPKDVKVLPGRFILFVKSDRNNGEFCEAGSVIEGHRDRLKKMKVHLSQTLQPSSKRMILAIATSHSFDIWTADVRRSHLRSKTRWKETFLLTSSR